jgi:hypothetical protein
MSVGRHNTLLSAAAGLSEGGGEGEGEGFVFNETTEGPLLAVIYCPPASRGHLETNQKHQMK